MPSFSFESKEQIWNLSPLTLGDLRRFKEYVQLRPWFSLQNQRERIPADEFAKESARVLAACSDKELTESSPEVQSAMETSEGVTQLVYLSLRRNHPNLTVEQCEELLNFRNLREVSEKLMACSGMVTAKKNEPTTAATIST